MAEVAANVLLKNLKIRPERVYFLYGKSIPDVEKLTAAIRKRAVSPDDELFNLHVFDGKTMSVSEVSAACSALPIFGGYVCIIVRDLLTEKLTAADIKILTETISNLTDSNVLVFSFTATDITEGKKTPAPKAKKIADLCSKIGSVCVCNPKTPAVLGKDIESYIKSIGGHIDPERAVFLAECCAADTQIALNECDKLVAFAPEVTVENIRKLTPRQLDANVFELARAVSAFNLKNAMQIFDELILERAEPVSILYTLAGNILDMYRAKTAEQSAKTPQNVKNDFSIPAYISFRVDNAFRDVRRSKIDHLRKCVQILTETDLQMKSTAMDNVILLQIALVKMMS
jgi:DNA polymerase-3 subunit delta